MAKENLPKASNKETEEIPAEVVRIIKDLPVQKRNVIIQAFAVSKQHSGPLPDSDTIRVYNEVIPNGGERLMATVEQQVNHRIEIEKIGVKRTFNQSSTGQWMGFIITIMFGVIAWDLARTGNQVSAIAGGVLGTIDLVALVALFVTTRSKGSEK